MTPSDNALRLIADAEVFRSAPYLCPANIPTIGYGTTIYPGGVRVTLKDAPITETDAAALLQIEVDKLGAQITRAAKVALTQGQFDALVSFAYNCGFHKLCSSTLWRKLNAGDPVAAAAQFPLWNRGGGKVLPGLVKRRAAERALFEGKAPHA